MIDQAKQAEVLKAIEVAKSQGGGEVYLPPGEYDASVILAALGINSGIEIIGSGANYTYLRGPFNI